MDPTRRRNRRNPITFDGRTIPEMHTPAPNNAPPTSATKAFIGRPRRSSRSRRRLRRTSSSRGSIASPAGRRRRAHGRSCSCSRRACRTRRAPEIVTSHNGSRTPASNVAGAASSNAAPTANMPATNHARHAESLDTRNDPAEHARQPGNSPRREQHERQAEADQRATDECVDRREVVHRCDETLAHLGRVSLIFEDANPALGLAMAAACERLGQREARREGGRCFRRRWNRFGTTAPTAGPGPKLDRTCFPMARNSG